MRMLTVMKIVINNSATSTCSHHPSILLSFHLFPSFLFFHLYYMIFIFLKLFIIVIDMGAKFICYPKMNHDCIEKRRIPKFVLLLIHLLDVEDIMLDIGTST